jgi:hypothetical protein
VVIAVVASSPSGSPLQTLAILSEAAQLEEVDGQKPRAVPDQAEQLDRFVVPNHRTTTAFSGFALS